MMKKHTSLSLHEELQVWKISAIGIAGISSKTKVSSQCLAQLLHIGSLVARTMVKLRCRSQDGGSHEGSQEKQCAFHV